MNYGIVAFATIFALTLFQVVNGLELIEDEGALDDDEIEFEARPTGEGRPCALCVSSQGRCTGKLRI